MKLSIWWKDAITKLFFLYVVFLFFLQIYGIYQSYTTLDSPLIPESLSSYIAFPLYFLLVIWGIGIFIFWRFIKNEAIQKNMFWVIPITLVGLMFIARLLYYVIMKFNPYQ